MSNDPQVVYEAGPLYEVQTLLTVGPHSTWAAAGDQFRHIDLNQAKAHADQLARNGHPARVIITPGITHAREIEDHE